MDAGVQEENTLVRIEDEGYSARFNDLLSTAEDFQSTDRFAIQGVIGSGDGIRGDVDYFRGTLRANTIYEIVATSTSVIPRVTIASGLGDPTRPTYLRRLTARGAVDARDIFVPEAGQYFIRIEDDDNAQGLTPIKGGPGFRYRVEFRRVDPVLVELAQGSRRGVLAIDGRGTLPVFRIELTEPSVLGAQIFAQRLPVPVPVDSTLYLVQRFPLLVRPVIETRESVVGSETKDAYMSAALQAGSYLLIADFDEMPRELFPEIETHFFRSNDEIEPNDDLGSSKAFHSPAQAALVPTSTSNDDVDVFRFRTEAGRLYTLEVEGFGDILPTLRFFDPQGILMDAQLNSDAMTNTRLEEILLPYRDTFHFAVGNARPQTAGGTYEYLVRLTPVDRVPELVGTLTSTTDVIRIPNQTLARSGERKWYRVVIGAEGPYLLALRTVDRQGTLNPRWALAGRNGVDPYGSEVGDTVFRLLQGDEYWLSIIDAESRGGSSFEVEAKLYPVQALGSVLPVMQLPLGEAQVTSLNPGGAHRYLVHPASPGCYLLDSVQSDTGTSRSRADTALTVTSTSGTVLANGENRPGSRFDRVVVQASGDFFVDVEAPNAPGPVGYGIIALEGVCP